MYIDREYSDGLEGDYIKYAVFISRRVYTHSFLSFLNVNTWICHIYICKNLSHWFFIEFLIDL